MTALFFFNPSYAAEVVDGETRLDIDDRGAPNPPPWTLPTDGDGAVAPLGLTVAGQVVTDIEVHPQGILVLDGLAFDAQAPRTLDGLGAAVIAPFWAPLAAGPCGETPGGIVEKTVRPDSLTITWREAQLSGCPAGGPRARFSVKLTWDAEAVVRQIEFRYRTLPTETLRVEPRAGFQLQVGDEAWSTFELLPDLPGGALRGRAKLLLDGSSDGEAGAWVMEVGDAGEVVGELEPDHFEADGRTPRQPDGWRQADNCPNHFNPLQENLDGDLWGDACDRDADDDLVEDGDNCPLRANPQQENNDGDDLGDACDPDDDNDGWLDVIDRCPFYPSSANLDLDGDDWGDACDPDPDGDDDAARWRAPLQPDTCPLVFDPDRRDTDRDGVGDACDLKPGTPCRFLCAWQRDADGDGIADLVDLCPTAPDPRQADRDGDGIGDACDPDVDGDGHSDIVGFWRDVEQFDGGDPLELDVEFGGPSLP